MCSASYIAIDRRHQNKTTSVIHIIFVLYVVAFQFSDAFCNVVSFRLSILNLLIKILVCMCYCIKCLWIWITTANLQRISRRCHILINKKLTSKQLRESTARNIHWVIKQVYRRRHERRRSPKPELH